MGQQIFPLLFVVVVGPGIRNGKYQDSGSGINIPDPQHWFILLDLITRISSPWAGWRHWAQSWTCCS